MAIVVQLLDIFRVGLQSLALNIEASGFCVYYNQIQFIVTSSSTK